MRSGLFVAIFALLTMMIGVVPAQASQILCGYYGQTPSFNCVSFSGFTGQRPWGYPVDGNGHNCTNYVTYRLWQNGVANPGNLGNAYQWDERAISYGIPVNNIPAIGSVAVWEANSGPALGSGHVAYVDIVTSAYIDISEDNYLGTTMRTRYFVGQSDWPDHFIHFKDVAPPAGVYSTESAGSSNDIVKAIQADNNQVMAVSDAGITETYWVTGTAGITAGMIVNTPDVVAFRSFTSSDGVRHVFYSKPDGLYEAWWTPGVAGVHTGKLATLSNVVDLSVRYSGGYMNIVSAAADGIYETYWKPGVAGVTTGKLVTLSGVTTLQKFIGSDGWHHVFFGRADGLYETYWKPGVAGVATGKLATINGVVGLHLSLSGDYMNIVSAAADGVYETYWKPGVAGVTTGRLATIPGVTGVQKMYQLDGTNSVFSSAADGIYETYWKPGVTGVTTGKLASIPNVTGLGVTRAADGAIQVYSRTSTGVYETWWKPGVVGVHTGLIRTF